MNRYYSFGQIEQDPTGGARPVVAVPTATIITPSRTPTLTAEPVVTTTVATVTPLSMLKRAVTAGRLTRVAPTPTAAAGVDMGKVLPIAAGALAALFLLK